MPTPAPLQHNVVTTTASGGTPNTINRLHEEPSPLGAAVLLAPVKRPKPIRKTLQAGGARSRIEWRDSRALSSTCSRSFSSCLVAIGSCRRNIFCTPRRSRRQFGAGWVWPWRRRCCSFECRRGAVRPRSRGARMECATASSISGASSASARSRRWLCRLSSLERQWSRLLYSWCRSPLCACLMRQSTRCVCLRARGRDDGGSP